jgi:hypothetical protein
LIVLAFCRAHGESQVLVRGTYFRISGDGALLGPDNAVTARYADGLWHMGRRQYRTFECAGPVYLRVTGSGGRPERSGPHAFIKVRGGAIFTHDTCLGTHVARSEFTSPSAHLWHEIVILSGV